MYDDIAGLRVTLEGDGFDRFEQACGTEQSAIRRPIRDEDGIESFFELRTCQRYELYARGPRARGVLADVGRRLDVDVTPEGNHLLTGEAVVEHVFRVACGLESGVIGEDEILGQLRDAHEEAIESGELDGRLETIVEKALRVGERARTETTINEGAVSLGSVTIDRIRRELDGPNGPETLAECEILVVGAGEVAELVVGSLACRSDVGDSLVVANRSRHGAERLARRVDGEAVRLDELSGEHLERADVVVSATAAEDRVLSLGRLVGHELVVVDLANPRDVDPAVADLDDVSLTTIDEVLSVRSDELERREAAIDDVRSIIDEELGRLEDQLRAERVDETLDRIYSQAHALRESELDRALARIDNEGEPITEGQEDAVRDLSKAIVNKLLHPKTSELRRAAADDDQETLDTLLRLFDDEPVEGIAGD